MADTRARVLVVRRQILDIGAGVFIGKPKPAAGKIESSTWTPAPRGC